MIFQALDIPGGMPAALKLHYQLGISADRVPRAPCGKGCPLVPARDPSLLGYWPVNGPATLIRPEPISVQVDQDEILEPNHHQPQRGRNGRGKKELPTAQLGGSTGQPSVDCQQDDCCD